MIRTAQQLKGKIRNLSMGDSAKAQMLMRTYATERFLERLSLSPYRENLILKGGTLVAALVGLEARSTMDVDTTIKSLPLTKEDIRALAAQVRAVLSTGSFCVVGNEEKIEANRGMFGEVSSLTRG